MPEQHEIQSAICHLYVARYLMSRADTRGMTHGQKHHLIEVALAEIISALVNLGDTGAALIDQNNDTDVSYLLRQTGDRF